MRWYYTKNNQTESVEWSNGQMTSTDQMAQMYVQYLIDAKEIVTCGLLGPRIEAGLENEIVAWGTISTAVQLFQEGKAKYPICPVIPKCIMDSPDNGEPDLNKAPQDIYDAITSAHNLEQQNKSADNIVK